jgi:hypothetical protein
LTFGQKWTGLDAIVSLSGKPLPKCINPFSQQAIAQLLFFLAEIPDRHRFSLKPIYLRIAVRKTT